MDRVVYTVKSHQRVDEFEKKTYNQVIVAFGFPLKKVFVFVSLPEDVIAYKKRFPKINIVLAPRGIVGVDNFITKYFPQGQRIVYMNDDVKGLYALRANENFERMKKTEVRDLIKKTFLTMKKYGITYGGLYQVKNSFFMKNTPKITFDFCTVLDPFSFVVNDRSVQISVADKSDFEKSILHFQKHGILLRHNHIVPGAEYFVSKGGFQGRNASTEMDSAKQMMKKYPDYISHIITMKNGRTTLRFKRIKAIKQTPNSSKN